MVEQTSKETSIIISISTSIGTRIHDLTHNPLLLPPLLDWKLNRDTLAVLSRDSLTLLSWHRVTRLLWHLSLNCLALLTRHLDWHSLGHLAAALSGFLSAVASTVATSI